MDSIAIVAVAVIVTLIVALGIRALWRILTIDWLGIWYDDPTSPYYHDKHGKGRGHG